MTDSIQIRKANLNDLPTLLEFEQGVVEAERVRLSTWQQNQYDYTCFLTFYLAVMQK